MSNTQKSKVKYALILLLGVLIGYDAYIAPGIGWKLPAPDIAHLQNGVLPHTFTSNSVLWANFPLYIVGIFAVAITASGFMAFLLIHTSWLHEHFSHDHTDAGPQKFHATPTPRIGGLAIFLGWLAGTMVVILSQANTPITPSLFYLILTLLPAFLGGFVEDITKKVGVSERLLLSMISGVIGIGLLGAIISHVDVPLLDVALHWPLFAIVFTGFAISGATNSINLIDGYNGLAGGFSVIALLAIGAVAYLVHDSLILVASVSMVGALLGFLLWNWPKGKLFMGDGGAYLVGCLMAELSVLLFQRHPSVTAWFPLLVLGYPIFETLFSMFRRKILYQTASGQPDARHLHQIVYKRIIRGHLGQRDPELMTRNNSRVAPYFWFPAVLVSIYAVLFWDNPTALMTGFFVGCMLYVFVYRHLSQAKRRYIKPNRLLPKENN